MENKYQETYLEFEDIDDAEAFARSNGIQFRDKFRFTVKTEPEIIFVSLHDYYYEG